MFSKIKFFILFIFLSMNLQANYITIACIAGCQLDGYNVTYCAAKCNTQKLRLCFDEKKYDGNDIVIKEDPLGCITKHNNKIVINYICALDYTNDLIIHLASLDPSRAFYVCKSK